MIKGVSKTIENEAKARKGGLRRILLGALGTSLLGNTLAGNGVIRTGEGVIRAGQDFSCRSSFN